MSRGPYLLIVRVLHEPSPGRPFWQARVEGLAVDRSDYERRAPEGSALWRGRANVGDVIYRVARVNM